MSSTREQIIVTTAELLEKQGYHATGLNQIVQESGAPKGSLYYHFPEGKEELTAEAIERSSRALAEHTRTELAQADDPATAIYTLILRLADHLQAAECRSGAPTAAVALETASTNDRLAAACQNAYDRLQAAFADKLREGGYPEAQAAELALFVVATIEGGIVLARTYRSAAPLQQLAGYVRGVLEGAR